MATLNNGILGGGRNKVGPVIMSKWKSIDYIRAYAVPANPNSSAQQTVRTKFAQLVSNAKEILGSVIKIYWDPFYSTKSGYNAFISANYSLIDDTNTFTLNNKLAIGSLTNVIKYQLNYDSTTGVVSFNWSIPSSGNILGTDTVSCAVYNKATKSFVASAILDIVSLLRADITIPSGLSSANLIFYFWTSRGTGSTLAVSDSSASNF